MFQSKKIAAIGACLLISAALFFPFHPLRAAEAKIELRKEIETFKPTLNIRLPGLQFSDLSKSVDEEGYLHIPWIGEFLAALYRFGLATVSIVAVVMLIRQGMNIIFGGEFKQGSYKRIPQIIIGLAIMWGSYALLYKINPDLVYFRALKVRYVEPRPDPEEASVETLNATLSADGYCIDTKTLITIENIPNIKSEAFPNQVVQDLILGLKKAGELAEQTLDPVTGRKFDGLMVVSAVRNLTKQTTLFDQAVRKYGSEEAAQSHVGKPNGCESGSSHLLGRAVDIRLVLEGKILGSTGKDMTEERINILQDAIMTPAGWVRYCREWWHFELGSPNQALRSTKCDRPYGTGNSRPQR